MYGSKIISPKGRLVECDIWLVRRFVDYMTIGQKFVELRQNVVENRLVQKRCLHALNGKTAIHAYNDMTISTDCRT